jgi:hypothetical protein
MSHLLTSTVNLSMQVCYRLCLVELMIPHLHAACFKLQISTRPSINIEKTRVYLPTKANG